MQITFDLDSVLDLEHQEILLVHLKEIAAHWSAIRSSTFLAKGVDIADITAYYRDHPQAEAFLRMCMEEIEDHFNEIDALFCGDNSLVDVICQVFARLRYIEDEIPYAGTSSLFRLLENILVALEQESLPAHTSSTQS